MASERSESFDELAFRRWLDTKGEAGNCSVDDLIERSRQVRNMIEFDHAKTDENIYISLFGNTNFKALEIVAQSRIKRVAILMHHFKLSSP